MEKTAFLRITAICISCIYSKRRTGRLKTSRVLNSCSNTVFHPTTYVYRIHLLFKRNEKTVLFANSSGTCNRRIYLFSPNRKFISNMMNTEFPYEICSKIFPKKVLQNNTLIYLYQSKWNSVAPQNKNSVRWKFFSRLKNHTKKSN